MFSKEAIALAEATVEAIKKIAEKAPKDCLKCKGQGVYYNQDCTVCHGTGKVKGKWEWKPGPGEWCIYKKNNEIALVVFYWPKTKANKYETIEVAFPLGANRSIEEFADEFIPLLDWQKIEEMLEGMGYRIKLSETFRTHREFRCSIHKVEQFKDREGYRVIPDVSAYSSNRQEAVQQAVIKLGKEE